MRIMGGETLTCVNRHYLTDMECAVYNLLNEKGPLTTAEIIFLIPGRDEQGLREAIRRMARIEAILSHRKKGPNRLWEVRS